MVWKDLIEKNMKKKEPGSARRMREPREKKSRNPRRMNRPGRWNRLREIDWDVDRQRLEDEIKSKEEIISELNRQIERSRQIDIEMEKKERGLLY